MKIFLLVLLGFSYQVFGSYQSDVVAETLWREARSEGIDGINHVASIIYNRSISSNKTIVDIVLAPKQFSCWNGKIVNVKTIKRYVKKTLISETDRVLWNYCKLVADQLVTNKYSPINTHNHYYDSRIITPRWAKNLSNKERIGNFTFGFYNMRF